MEIGPKNARGGEGRCFGFGGSLVVKTIGNKKREDKPRKNEKPLILHVLLYRCGGFGEWILQGKRKEVRGSSQGWTKGKKCRKLHV